MSFEDNEGVRSVSAVIMNSMNGDAQMPDKMLVLEEYLEKLVKDAMSHAWNMVLAKQGQGKFHVDSEFRRGAYASFHYSRPNDIPQTANEFRLWHESHFARKEMKNG